MKKRKFFVEMSTNIVILLILVCMGLICYNTTSQYVFSNNGAQAIYHGDTSSNKVSLMINVYWGSEYLDDMLQVLDSYNVKCTFFVGGQWVEREPEYLVKIYEKGHEIANHGYFHQNHKKLSYDQNFEEINVCHKLVEKTIGYSMNLFAPPSGEYSKTTLDVASKLGYRTIMWSKDTIDWRDKDSDLIYSRATDVKGGDLVLMHPTQHTLMALPRILEYYKLNNLLATTVTDNLG